MMSVRTNGSARRKSAAPSFTDNAAPHDVSGPSRPSPFRPRLLMPVAATMPTSDQNVHSYAEATVVSTPMSAPAAVLQTAAVSSAPPASTAADAMCTYRTMNHSWYETP